jgi:hypothetical protein
MNFSIILNLKKLICYSCQKLRTSSFLGLLKMVRTYALLDTKPTNFQILRTRTFELLKVTKI